MHEFLGRSFKQFLEKFVPSPCWPSSEGLEKGESHSSKTKTVTTGPYFSPRKFTLKGLTPRNVGEFQRIYIP